MTYALIFSKKAKKHLADFEKSGNQPLVRKIEELSEELKEHP